MSWSRFSRETEPIGGRFIEREIYFKEFAHTVVGASKLKSAGQAGTCSKNRCFSLESNCSLEAEFLPLLGTSILSLQAFN